MRAWVLAAGAAALPLTIISATGAAQTGAAASGWWYVGQGGQAPQRQLVFVDRSSVRRTGNEASTRATHVFEQPRNNFRGYSITYAFRCGARRFQTRDGLFTSTANMEERENGILDDWSVVPPNSVAALILDAACSGRFDSAARRIAGAPLAEAQGIFQNLDRAPQQVAAAAPRGGGLMPRDQLVGCLNGTAPVSPACREARASAARGRGVAQPRQPRQPSLLTQVRCRGTAYVRNEADGSFSGAVSLDGGEATLSINPDPHRMSGRYRFAQVGGRIEIYLRNNILARYEPRSGGFLLSFVGFWEGDDIDPRNPFPVQYSAPVDYRGTCS